jgi:hypothetical protein
VPNADHAMGSRRLLITFPIALAVAAAAHGLRFGDEHAFGEEYHDWVCTVLLAGLPALAWAFLARAVASLTTYGNGSVLAERLTDLLPARGSLPGLAATLAAFASAIYVGVERLEADGDTSYAFALAVVGALSLCVSIAMRRMLGYLAHVTLALFRLIVTQSPRGPRPRFASVAPSHPTPRLDWAAVRLGRAPPLAA